MSPILVVLCCAAAAEAPSQAEVRTALASIEEWLTTPVTLEVTYRRHYEWVPGGESATRQLLPDLISTWIYAPNRMYFADRIAGPPEVLQYEAVFDGQRTTEWVYESDGKVRALWRRSGAPPESVRMRNELAYSLGLYAWSSEEGLLPYLKAALSQNSPPPAQWVNGALEIQFHTPGQPDDPQPYIVRIDADNGYRLSGWRLGSKDAPLNTDPSGDGDHIDDFQLVDDESESGKVFSFPRRVHRQGMNQVTKLEVISLRLNHDVQDEHFRNRDPPIGTIIYEVAAVPGAPDRRSIVGGEAAHQQRIAEIVAEAQESRATLDHIGVTFDATPANESYSTHALVIGVLLLALALCLRVGMRRS